ncbi:7SK snRNA methylphosphate capping enzyme isoform X1 [Hippocampus comes]|uniref:7SK snRNA methylphosphate capping enzyme isoform X1 n=2 Tax=Hippocampus comes TaxID=109280 RepID=UPI00094ECC0E|nr:PREDICTED: 7SK snRNA methylphosphate capping enzyme-like isoform X1 [Hippocampus comes]
MVSTLRTALEKIQYKFPCPNRLWKSSAMSVDEDTVKTASPQASSTSSLQISECSGSFSAASVLAEGAAVAASDLAASCPVPGTAASPKHTSTVDALSHSHGAGPRSKGNEVSINRRNSFHHGKQHQQMRVAKRRNTSSFSFKHPSSGKRRRRVNSESDSVLPTNFLLGGNIFDPLNLNSLQDEEVNRALNAETPKSSPLPAKSRDPVEILIPRDITDPLNLNSCIGESSFLVSPLKSGGRRRHRNRHHGGSFSTQLHLCESGKNEVKTGDSVSFPGTVTRSNLEVSKVSDRVSGGEGDSRVLSADDSSSLKEEATSISMEDSTSSAQGGVNQHISRRKRRRNSGKMDPPVTHSTPVAKSASGEQNHKPGGSKNSFHTPRSGSKSAPGGRQHQHPHNQARDQQKKKFQYGNYNKYYGYRNPSANEDPRVHVFRPEWFEGKRVLDLGCNSGHLTLYIAKMLRPARILGLDIDNGLVHAARKNIRHYLSEMQTQEARRATQEGNAGCDGEERHTESRENGDTLKGESGLAEEADGKDSCGTEQVKAQRQDGKIEKMERVGSDQPGSCSFPLSLQISRGPIAAPPLTESSTAKPGEFPANVSFIKANYVLQNDNLLVTQRPEYDVILCMSVTKWVHLNWGDSGLKRLFKRVYRHLHPGGLFILEPQPWQSYIKRKKLTDTINRNFHSIRLKPDQFSSYLTNEVGFTSCEFLGTPKSLTRGFQRPIYLFHK